MYRPLSRAQVLLTLASVACLFVATPSMAQVQTSALALETEALDLKAGMEGKLSSAGLSTEAWRAVTRYIEQDQYGVEWTVESGSDELVHEDAKLLPSDGALSDYFGNSVAVSGDTVVVAAPLDDDQGDRSGSAYVFERPAGGWSGTLSQAAKLLASDGASGYIFGNSVAVSGDTVVVGAPLDDDQGESSGSAYVFGPADSDGDGVPDELDVCADTVIPEGVPTRRLGRNRFALVDDDGVFDTNRPRGRGPGVSFTIEETGGCSCEQIIDALGLGKGHVKFGCSIGAMETWAGLVNP